MKRQELIEATDEYLDEVVKFIDPIVMRGLLYQLTGDESVAAIPNTTKSAGFLGYAPAITDPAHIALLQNKAAAFLKAYRDKGAGDQPLGPEARLHRSLELACGGKIPAAELEMWIEQIAIDPWARGLKWRHEPADAQRNRFMVAVIGAGMGGLNAAVHLKRTGIPFVVIEKNGGVGGTWHENRYPGARVNTTSKTYFHSFGIDYHCPNPFCEQRENEKYFNWVADHFGLRANIVLNSEVKSMSWDDRAEVWEIHGETPDGPHTWRVNAIISSVGFLNRPNYPNFPGSESFRGTIVHTARWPQKLDLPGKRIAVIGSGATGYQMVPQIAKEAGHLTLFQRAPSWCFEMPGYLSPYPPQMSWLDRNFPYLVNFTRFQLSWLNGPDVIVPLFALDPDFEDPHAVSAENQRVRELCLDFLQRKLGERPDLIEKMLPVAPPMTSRPVLVDPQDNIYDALLRDNVTLVSDPITQITPSGLRTGSGQEFPVDVIIYATGFKASEYLWPMVVRGRDGKRVEELWEKDGARAYLGTLLPGFPNLFMLYGPNTNPFGTGLGVIEMLEMTTRFALKCLEELILEDRGSIEVTRDAYDRYNAALDAAEPKRVYSDRRVTSYFRNEHNRSAVNCPFDVRLLWNWMRDPVRADRVATDPVIRPWLGGDLSVARG